MIAAKQPIVTYPTRTNQIPRHIPPPHWASHPYVLFAAAGLLPFGTIFVELYFAMTSIWQVSGLQFSQKMFFWYMYAALPVVKASNTLKPVTLHLIWVLCRDTSTTSLASAS